MRVRSSLVALALTAVAACSGAEPTDLFSAPGGSAFPNDPAGDPGAQGGSSGSAQGAGSSGGASSPGSTATSDSGAPPPSPLDAAVPPPPPPPPPPTNSGIYCGAAGETPLYCTGTNKCCADQGYSGTSFSCDDPAACGGTVIACDSRADCPSSQVCCGAFSPGDGYIGVECKASCTSGDPGVSMVRFCDLKAAVDECISIGKRCGPSGSLTGFYRCN